MTNAEGDTYKCVTGRQEAKSPGYLRGFFAFFFDGAFFGSGGVASIRASTSSVRGGAVCCRFAVMAGV